MAFGLFMGMTLGTRQIGGVSPPAVPTLSINSIGPQESSGDIPFNYTISAAATCEVLLGLAATANPDASDFGADSGGGADAGGYTALTDTELDQSGDPVNIAIPDGLQGSYKLHFLPPGGGDADVASSGAVTIDTTAPVYDSSTPADDGTDIAIDTTIAITFDEAIAAGSGTFVLYDVTGAAVVETFTVGGSGDNGGTISISTPTVTLTPGADLSNSNAYSVRWTAGAITDAFSNPVAANSGDTLLNFTTVAAAPTFAVERAIADYIGSSTVTSTPSFTVNLSAYPAGTRILCFYGNEYLVISGTIQGVSVDIEQLSGTTSGARASAFSAVLTSDGSPTATITLDVGTALGFHALDVWAITGGAVVDTATQTRADATPFSISVTPDNADNVILAFVAGRQDAATAFTWDTLTEVDDERVAAGNNSYMTTAWAQDVTSGVAYSITGSLAGSTFRHSMVALAITPV